jgi:hypothetical protein
MTHDYSYGRTDRLKQVTLTDAQKEMQARALAAINAEKDSHPLDLADEWNDGYCTMCNENVAVKRTLCGTCYKAAERVGEVNTYPTKMFLNDPEAHILWAIEYFPEVLYDALFQAGWDVTRPHPEP